MIALRERSPEWHRGFLFWTWRARRGSCNGAGGEAVRGGARRAQAGCARCLRGERGRRGRHAGRRVLPGLPDAPGALAAAQAITQGSRLGHPAPHRAAHRDASPRRGGIRRTRCPSSGTHRRGGPRRPGSSRRTTAALLEVELRDLGEHRLKDLSAPERIYQVGESDFPPLASLRRTNLPVPATPFLGREAELREVAEM